MTLGRVKAVAVVELRRILRDRTSFSLIILVPVLQIILFGAAVDLNPKNIGIAVAGGTPAAQDSVVGLITETGYFAPPEVLDQSGDARLQLAAGLVKVAIELPDDSSLFDDLEAEIGPVSIVVDGADIGAVAPALAALERAVWREAARRSVEAAGFDGAFRSLETLQFEWLYNPDKKTAWTILPGLIGVVVMISMLMLGALSLVREREHGTWEALMLLPVSASDVLIGKVLPYLAVAVLQVTLVTAVAITVFGVPLAGSAVTLALGALALAIAHLSLGFVISLLAANQMQALQGAVAFYLPSMLLSGFMFPFDGMPVWAQKIGYCLPLTHFVDLARDVMLRGATTAQTPSIMAIAAFALGFAVLASYLYRRTN